MAAEAIIFKPAMPAPAAQPMVQITTATGGLYLPPPPPPVRSLEDMEAEQAEKAKKGAWVGVLFLGDSVRNPASEYKLLKAITFSVA